MIFRAMAKGIPRVTCIRLHLCATPQGVGNTRASCKRRFSSSLAKTGRASRNFGNALHRINRTDALPPLKRPLSQHRGDLVLHEGGYSLANRRPCLQLCHIGKCGRNRVGQAVSISVGLMNN